MANAKKNNSGCTRVKFFVLAFAFALALALAGCASAPAKPPATSPSATPVPATATPIPASATPAAAAPKDEVVFVYDARFANETSQGIQSFRVPTGHWLCAVTNVTATSGDAVISMESADAGLWTTLASTPKKLDADVMVPWTGENFVVHLNLTGFTGRIVLNVTNEA